MANVRMDLKIQNKITSSIASIQKKLDALPQEAYKEFVKNTPIRTGNARRNTKLRGDEIQANYAYAEKLNEGYSQQSPDGMTSPTEAFLKKRLKQILKGK
jgi:hypothetical protein